MTAWVRLLCLALVAPFALIVLVNLIPDDVVLDQLEDDFASGALVPVNGWRSSAGNAIDLYGECVLTTVGVGDGSQGWFSRAATSPNLGPCERLAVSLEERAATGEIRTSSKIRYWNGLSIIARPGLALAGVQALRLLGFVSLLAGLGALGREAHRIAGPAGAAALLSPIVLTGDLPGLIHTFHHPMMFGAAAGLAAWLMRRAADGADRSTLVLMAATAAAVYNVTDLFNFVPGIWLATTGLVATALPASRSLRERVGTTVGVAIAWPVAYVTTWLGAWLWAALATSPRAVFDEVRGQIEFRVNGENETASGEFGVGLRRVVRAWLDEPAGDFLIVAMLAAGGAALWSLRSKPAALAGAAVAAAPALLVVPFMLVTNNHHEIHFWFEFRSLPLLAGLALFAVITARTGRFSGPDFVPS